MCSIGIHTSHLIPRIISANEHSAHFYVRLFLWKLSFIYPLNKHLFRQAMSRRYREKGSVVSPSRGSRLLKIVYCVLRVMREKEHAQNRCWLWTRVRSSDRSLSGDLYWSRFDSQPSAVSCGHCSLAL